MLFDDTYQSLASPAEGIFRDRGSKFIAYAYPLRSEDEVKPLLLALKKEHPTARHHCYAWRLGVDRTVFRVNDDGEPSGSAGRPILNCLLSKELTNVIVFVVRYFGGTLLGVPGLINAYKEATLDCINQAEIVERKLYAIYRMEFEYLQMNEVMKILKEESLKATNQVFDNACSMEVEINKSIEERVIGRLKKVQGLHAMCLFSE